MPTGWTNLRSRLPGLRRKDNDQVTDLERLTDKFWGRTHVIEGIYLVADQWKVMHQNQIHPFVVTEISKWGGGPLPPHKSHRTGLDVDIRPLATTPSHPGPVSITDPIYSSELTRQLIFLLLDTGRVRRILFNDRALIARFPQVVYWPNHDNHLHVSFFSRETWMAKFRKKEDIAAVAIASALS